MSTAKNHSNQQERKERMPFLQAYPLLHHYLLIPEKDDQNNRVLIDLLETIDFNLLLIYTRTSTRVQEIKQILEENLFPVISLTTASEEGEGEGEGKEEEEEEIRRKFNQGEVRILVTNKIYSCFGQNASVIILEDLIGVGEAEGEGEEGGGIRRAQDYLCAVGKAGHYGMRGLIISLLSKVEEKEKRGEGDDGEEEEEEEEEGNGEWKSPLTFLLEIGSELRIPITKLPDQPIDSSRYM